MTIFNSRNQEPKICLKCAVCGCGLRGACGSRGDGMGLCVYMHILL